MKITVDRLFLLLFGITVWSFLYSALLNENFQYVFMMLMCALCLFDSNFQIKINGTIKIYVAVVILVQLCIPVIQYYFSGTTTVIVYSVIHMVYLLTIISGAYFIAKHNIFLETCVVYFVLQLLYIVVCYLKTPTNLFDLSNIIGIITNVDRIRNNYNGIHANNIGNMCAFMMMVGHMFKPSGGIREVLKIIAYIFSILLLISTGSRGGCVALLIFWICYYGINFVHSKLRVSGSKSLSNILLVLIFITGIIMVFFLSFGNFSLDLDELNDMSSGRLYGWQSCIENLKSEGRLFIGFDFVNPITLFQSGNYGKLIADNWFVYVWLTTGVIGLICMVIMILTFAKSTLDIFTFTQFDIALFSFFIAKVFYGLFEISFYTLSDPSSLLLFMFIVANIYRMKCYENLTEEIL